LHTHLVVREDAQLLYGFTTKIERTLFKELLKVSGVGASSGQLSSSGRAQAEEALAALGYKPAETKRLLDKVPDEGQSVEELIRAALRLAAN